MEFGNCETVTFDDVPQELSLPIIGTAWTYLPVIGKYNISKLHESNWHRHLKYGKIVREDCTSSLTFLHICDARDIEKLFRQEGRCPNRPSVASFQIYRAQRKDLFRSGGFFADNGEQWYELRSKSQKHLMRPKSVHHYLPAVDDVAQDMIQRISTLKDKNNEVPDFRNEVFKWAFESVALVAFDTKLNSLASDMIKDSEILELVKVVQEMFVLMHRLEFSALKLWKVFPSSTWNEFVKAMDTFTNATIKYLNNAIERIKILPQDKTNLTFLENLLIKEEMTIGSLSVIISDLAFAGIDTTSHTIAFALYYLARNPDCQEKLYQEICRHMPNPSDPLTIPILNQCRYLKACLKESMRLEPVISYIPRILNEDIVLSGYRIPAGVMIMPDFYVVSRLEEYFPEPQKFKPERWMREDKPHNLEPFAAIPFGFGPRSCLGRRVAEQEMWTLLIRILQNFRVEYHHEDIHMVTKLINSPDKPFRFSFVKK